MGCSPWGHKESGTTEQQHLVILCLGRDTDNLFCQSFYGQLIIRAKITSKDGHQEFSCPYIVVLVLSSMGRILLLHFESSLPL